MGQNILNKILGTARSPEIDRASRFIQDITKELTGAQFFLNFFAPTGFAKTALLERLEAEHARVLPTSFVHIGNFFRQENRDIALRELLVQIIRDLGQGLPRRITIPSDYAEWTDNQRLATALIELVSEAKDYEKVSLLLLDDYDLMPEEQRRWLQENVFGPCSRTRRFGVILTSKTELRFTESFELRMRLTTYELKGLSSEDIAKALPEYSAIAEMVHRITGGLPILATEFIEYLERSGAVTPAEFQIRAKKLTRDFYSSFVEGKFFADWGSEIRDTMLILALLRRFDVKVLKVILPELLPEDYNGYTTPDYLDLINRLRPWVEWRRQGGYALNPSLSLMLQSYMFIIKLDYYKQVNTTAEFMCRGWLENKYRQMDLLELMYHIVALDRANRANGLSLVPGEASQSKVTNELLKYLEGNGSQYLGANDLEALLDSIKDDTDLQKQLTETGEQRIRKMIDENNKEASEKNNGLHPKFAAI